MEPRGGAPDLPRPGERLGGYVFERLLGRGGMGAVYLARNGELRRAVKVALFAGPDADEWRARFEREAQALAKVPPHHHVLRVHSVGSEGSRGFCVLDLIEGESLEQLIARGPVPIDRALEIGEQVARALAHVHASGIIHRDLKPANVLLRGDDGSAVLMDFGLARDQAERERLTQTGVTLGTPTYMSPEQALSAKNVDAQTDVYGAGAILYALIAGRPPHSGTTLVDVLAKVVGDEPTPLSELRPEVPAPVEVVVRRAVAKDRAQRYANASALADDLARLRRGEAASVITRDPTRHRRRLVRVAIVVATLGSIAFAAWAWGERERQRQAALSWRSELSATKARVETLSSRLARRALLGLAVSADVAPIESAVRAFGELRAHAPRLSSALQQEVEDEAREVRRLAAPVLVAAALDRSDFATARRELEGASLPDPDRTVLDARTELAQGRPADALARLEKLAGQRRVERVVVALEAEVQLGHAERALDRLSELEKDERTNADLATVLRTVRPRLAELCASGTAWRSARGLASLEALVADVSSARRPLLACEVAVFAKEHGELAATALRVLDRIDAADPRALAGREIAGLYEVLCGNELGAGRLHEAACAFERARRADPELIAGHDLRLALAGSRLGCAQGGKLAVWVDRSLDEMRAGILDEFDTTDLRVELRDKLWSELEARQRDADWVAQLAFANTTTDEVHEERDAFRRCERIARDLAENQRVPLDARARARFVRALLLYFLGHPDDAMAASRDALDFGYGKPDYCYELLTSCALAVPEKRAEALGFAREAARLADERTNAQPGTPTSGRLPGRPLIHASERERTSARETLVEALIASGHLDEAEGVVDVIEKAESQRPEILDRAGPSYEALRVRAKVHFARGLEDAEELVKSYVRARSTPVEWSLNPMAGFFRRIGNESVAGRVDEVRARLSAPRR